MDAYRYDPETKVYTGIMAADPDPFNDGEFILPGHSTWIAPPEEQTGYNRVWNAERGQWEYEAIPEQTVFTKLSIRRAMRELGIEAKLDGLLNASAEFRADWTDAQEIDLADPVLLAALESGTVTAEEIADIKRIAGGRQC